MADSMSINGATNGIDISRWKKLTPQEIIKEKSNGQEIPTEIINWAEEMAAFSKIPDDVTYEDVDGDVGIDALMKLGIENEIFPEDNNAIQPEETETTGAVKDLARSEELGEDTTQDENNIFANTQGIIERQNNTEPTDQTQEELTLADPSLSTNPEEIRKRKERKGLT